MSTQDFSTIKEITVKPEGGGEHTFNIYSLQDKKTVTVTKSGSVDVTPDSGYDGVKKVEMTVDIPIQEGAIVPTGTKTITSNGKHDVTNYAEADVNVPIPDGYVVPSGEVNITSNGTHNVSGKATAKVNVPIPDGYLKPAGSLTVYSNGVHDVKNYAEVDIQVPDTVTEVTSAADMDTLLNSEDAGKMVRYMGTDTTKYDIERYYVLKKGGAGA